MIGGEEILDAITPGEQPQLTRATWGKRGALRGANGALQLRVPGVPEGLGEPDNGGRTAVRGMSDLMGRQEGQLGNVVNEVPGERLLRRAEGLVFTAEPLGKGMGVWWHRGIRSTLPAASLLTSE